MKSKLPLSALAIVAALSAAALSSAYAEEPEQNDALAISSASITLSQAIAAAEQQVGGAAARAEFDAEHGKGVYDIEVVNGKTVTDVEVDPTSGNVISAKADPAGHEHEGDQDGAD